MRSDKKPRVFSEPNERMFAELRDLLAALPVQSTLEPAPCVSATREPVEGMRRGERDVDVRGPVSTVLRHLRRVLHQDALEWKREARDYNVVYELAIAESTFLSGALDVMTRLHDGRGSGRLSYGRTILRHSDDEYWLWEDD